MVLKLFIRIVCMDFKMLPLVKIISTLVFILSYATVCFASGGSHGAGHAPADISTLFWPTCNFILYICLMTYLYRKFARPVLRDQRIELEAFVARAQNEMLTLSSEAAQIKDRISMIQEEKADIIAELEREGRLTADALIMEANQKARRLKEDATKWYESETQRTRSEAKRELVGRIISKVRADLRIKFSSEEDKQFIKSNLVGLPSGMKN